MKQFISLYYFCKMEINIKVLDKDNPVEGVTAMIVDGPAGWVEIAAVSNEEGLLSLPIQAGGDYTVRLYTPNGQLDVEVSDTSLNTVEV
jgi:hypothetical protein